MSVRDIWPEEYEPNPPQTFAGFVERYARPVDLDPYIVRALDRTRPFPLRVVIDPSIPVGMAALVPPGEALAELSITRGRINVRPNPRVVMVGPVAIEQKAHAQDVYWGRWPNARHVATIPPMTDFFPTPFIDTEAELPDSEELAAKYEAKALEMENQAADATSSAQQIGLRAGAGTFRRKAAEIRARLAT